MLTAVSNIKIKRYPKRTLAYVRNVGPYMGDTELFERLFNTVMEWAAPQGLMTERTEAITVYHDDPSTVPSSKQRISVGFTVPEKTITPEGIHLMTIPEGKYVVGTYEIFPEEYRNAWKEVLDFIRDENIKPTPLEFESYKNDPNTHPEGKHIVDICVQIE